jgi:hypothetical protein
MKIAIYKGVEEVHLSSTVNSFLSNITRDQIIDIKISTVGEYIVVMVVYDEENNYRDNITIGVKT